MANFWHYSVSAAHQQFMKMKIPKIRFIAQATPVDGTVDVRRHFTALRTSFVETDIKGFDNKFRAPKTCVNATNLPMDF